MQKSRREVAQKRKEQRQEAARTISNEDDVEFGNDSQLGFGHSPVILSPSHCLYFDDSADFQFPI